jgi:hypothetical protein
VGAGWILVQGALPTERQMSLRRVVAKQDLRQRSRSLLPGIPVVQLARGGLTNISSTASQRNSET